MSNPNCTCNSSVSEPFRIFFPLGMLFGLAGVALWPLFYTGWLNYYPNIAHTRVMIEGFAALFIFGFLMTAGPRLLDAPGFTKRFTIATLALATASNLSHLANKSLLGDSLFALACGLILLGAAQRFRKRGDTPPPGFPLAALGLLCALVGSVLLALTASVWPNTAAFATGKILLFQGFTLLPIIGVGGYFFPKILASSNLHDFPETLRPDAAWKRRFRSSLLVAAAFLVSVALEVAGQTSAAYALRSASLGLYLVTQVPFREYRPKNSPHGRQLFLALATIAVGLVGAALFPAQRVAWLHAYFLVGLTGVIFLVSLRVIFGHGGYPQLIKKSAPLFGGIILALALAAATRIFADFHLESQRSHYLYAAALWLACGLVWLLYVAPKTIPQKQAPPSSC